MMKQKLLKRLFSCILLITSNIALAIAKKDGYLVLAIPVKPSKLDPVTAMNAHSKYTLPLIFESLIAVNSKQALQPVLAKSWNIEQKNNAIIINLNPHHVFSDNTEVTAKSVVKSIHRLCSHKRLLSGLKGCGTHRPQVFSLSKYSVKFNVEISPSAFLYQLSSPNTVIVKETSIGLIGSGPYKIQEQSDSSLTLTKNPFYAGNSPSKNAGIILLYVGDNEIQKRLMQDKLDGALMYRMESLWNFKDNNYKLINTNPNITEIFVFNNQRFPFNQPIVRKAIAGELYNHFQASCIPGAHKAYGIIPNGIGGSLTSMPPSTLPEITPQEVFTQVPQLKSKSSSVIIHQLYDIKKDCERKRITEIAKKFNINVKFQYHKDYSDLLPLYFNHHLDGFIDLYVFKNREASNILAFFSKNGGDHANASCSIDKMLEEAIETTSSHERFQIYHRIAQTIQDNNLIVPLFYMDHGNLMRKNLSGIADNFVFNPFLELLPKISK